MSQYFKIHPKTPKQSLINQSIEILKNGGIIAYPTDSCYALGCHIGDQQAIQRIRLLRKLDDHHNMTLVCQDLSKLSYYARVDNPIFRFIKSLIPGPYTFLLRATTDVPRRLQHPKRKTIGLRVPDHLMLKTLLKILDEGMISTSLILPGHDLPLTNAEDINKQIGKQIDLIIDGGICGLGSTTVIDLVCGKPELVRQGLGVFQ